jgi:Ca-activated chloride channel family protein
MQQLANDGIGKIQAGDIDVRLSRRPIERYEWPLGLGVLCLASSILIGDRKRVRRRATARSPVPAAAAAVGIVLFASPLSQGYAAAPGIDDYQVGNFTDAYTKFQDTLKAHPQTGAADKLNFDSGAAAYKMKEYGKALEAFSQALLSPDQALQSKSHYNLGNTLYERGEAEQTDEKKLGNWNNALQHYDETLKLDSQNTDAKENREFVRKKIEELKNKKAAQRPPSNSNKQQQSQDSPEPSEAAKRAKAEADKAVMRNEYRRALNIMDAQLKIDPTTAYYGDYIKRLDDINGVHKTDNP